MRSRSPKRWIAGILVGAMVLASASVAIRAWRQGDPLAQGISAYGRGDWSGAAASARSKLEFARSDPIALRLLARSSARLGKDESAEAIYRRLGTSSMEAEDLFLLGSGLLRRGKPGPAMASLLAARDADPDHAETLDALAVRYAEIGSTEEAAEAAERLASRPGWEVRGRVRLAPLLRRLREPARAARAISEALAIDPRLQMTGMTPGEAATLLAACLLECGRADEAALALAGSGDPLPGHEAAWLLSRVRLQQGKLAEAKAALKEAGDPVAADPMRPEPSPFVGEGKCAGCHDNQFNPQQQSRHASTFMKTADLKEIDWPMIPVVDPANPAVRHSFHRSDGGVEVITRVAGQEFRALIEYALGSNHQGQSFLARDGQGRTRELRISRYPADTVWDRTNQHPERPPDDVGYLGRPLAAASACIDCHVTNSRGLGNPQGHPEAADRGIGCERCHGPGGNHLLALESKFPEPAIARPRLAKADRIMALCGDCHKAPAGLKADEPGFIRFQTPNLAMSRCYSESGGGMSCVTCHDPHRDAVKTSSHYERACLSCHGPALARGKIDGAGHRSPPCPINPSAGCLECHMPRVVNAVPRSTFTDHYIRVHRDESRATNDGRAAGN